MANTLDKLYDLSLQKSDEAPEVVIKLSEMLDYMLYQTNEKTVSIDKELALVRQYLSLEKLGWPDDFNWHIQNLLTEPKATIHPMLLVTVVEALFSQLTGLLTPKNLDLVIKKQATQAHIQLLFSWKNGHSDATRKGIDTANFPTVKQQLNLVYPHQHQLEIQQKLNQIELNIWVPIELNHNNTIVSPSKTLAYE